MRKSHLIFLLILFLTFIATEKAKASHAVGANITYEYFSPNNYIVTVKFYRDCTGLPTAAPTTTVDVDYESASCNVTGFVTLNAVAGTGGDIQTGLYPPCGATSCHSGTGYGVQEWVYRGHLILPSACTDWVISCTIMSRNALITTINIPLGGVSMYVETTLDNLNYPTNSSPVFSQYPVSTFCLNHAFTYNQGATDPNQDSLVFSLVDALSGSGTVVPYLSPYTGANPFSSSTGITIDPHTGIISFNPNVLQVGVMAVLVQEYRAGVLIGSVRRDMQVNIEALCNFPPNLQASTFNNITANCGDSIIYMHLPVKVRCNSISPDGTDFRLLDPTGISIPTISCVGINCSGSPAMTDSIALRLFNPLYHNGTYHIWSKVGFDGNTLLNECGNAMPEHDSVAFSFSNCYSGVVDLTNVSVDNVNSNMEVYWTPPAGLPVTQFQSFDIYRGNSPGALYTKIGSVTSITATSYVDNDPVLSVPSHPYSYAVALHLNTAYLGQASDSIQSIFLTGVQNADSTTISLSWSPYWGWSNPFYELMESDDGGATFSIVPGFGTSSTSLLYTKPSTVGTYLLRIHSSSGSYLSRSNWYRFDVVKSSIVAANVITPNNDKLNDSFIFENLELYPNSKLHVFNRWGRKVFESGNYQNDWKGDDLTAGVYYYTLIVADKKSTEMSGVVTIIRN